MTHNALKLSIFIFLSALLVWRAPSACAGGILEFLQFNIGDSRREVSPATPTSLLYQDKARLNLDWHTEDLVQVQQQGRDIWRAFNQRQEQSLIVPLKSKYALWISQAGSQARYTAWFNKSGAFSTLDYTARETRLAAAGKLTPKLWAGYSHDCYQGGGDGSADFSPSFTAWFGAPPAARLDEKYRGDIYELKYCFSPNLSLRAQGKSYGLDTALTLWQPGRSVFLPFRHNGTSWDAALCCQVKPGVELVLQGAQGKGGGNDSLICNSSPIGDTRTAADFTQSSLSFLKFNPAKNTRMLLAWTRYTGAANLEANANLEPFTGSPGQFGHFLVENNLASTAYQFRADKTYRSHWNVGVELQHQELQYCSRLKTANTYYWGAVPWVYTDQDLFDTKGQMEMLGFTVGYKNRQYALSYNITQYFPHDFKDERPAGQTGTGGGGGGGAFSLSSPGSTTRGGTMQTFSFTWEF